MSRAVSSWFSPKTEKRASGIDWRAPELQRRYAGYFSRYLEERFAAAG